MENVVQKQVMEARTSRIKYRYIRDDFGNPMSCVTYYFVDDNGKNILKFDFASIHPNDDFKKEIARSLSAGRCIQCGFHTNAGSKTVMDNELWNEVLTTIGNSHVEYCSNTLKKRIKKILSFYKKYNCFPRHTAAAKIQFDSAVTVF